ncbi:MAG TPA: NrfD/PsrC family molybdoenzyme membrane anchor subunit [Candidatus Acidoferrales bacterium]|nr:NrfD/PsrC family molybdoenzyme membrane anchor subunit [Candidatus Acidoferrales bacterium]
MDSHLIARGLDRAPFKKFLAWIIPWAAVLLVGMYAIFLVLLKGLNQTNMDNRFSFGLWIFLDLSVIALGAGAFFTGFLLYILKKHELKSVISSAVVIGFICYSGAILILMVDVGQPLRAWFTFWHPNVHSMLTEVTFCITCYLTVLAIEYIPLIFKNRKLREIPSFLVFEFQLHKVIPIFAGVGTFLSFFHQGSLGGLYGVLQGRPFAFREGIAIWPSTFFLFIISAAASGPSFIILTTWLVSKLSRKRLVKDEVFRLLAKISGSLLIFYVLLKSIDTMNWMDRTVPSHRLSAMSYYLHEPFSIWVLFAEIIVFGLIPALVFIFGNKKLNPGWLVLNAGSVCCGILLNRFVMTIQTLAVPTLPFDKFMLYTPSWQEIATFLFVIAYGVLTYSFSFRYLKLFPQERETSYE